MKVHKARAAAAKDSARAATMDETAKAISKAAAEQVAAIKLKSYGTLFAGIGVEKRKRKRPAVPLPTFDQVMQAVRDTGVAARAWQLARDAREDAQDRMLTTITTMENFLARLPRKFSNKQEKVGCHLEGRVLAAQATYEAAWESEDAAWEQMLERKGMLLSLAAVLRSYADPDELDESMNEVWQDAEREIQGVHEHVDKALERLKAEEKEMQLARKAQRRAAKEARVAHKAQRTD